ncbi:hypothetical protein GOBAR_DD05231 [Gossypium barbadense]|nr:hypothetical protein GOBAR_DD05231 [Gossypium barbadense]
MVFSSNTPSELNRQIQQASSIAVSENPVNNGEKINIWEEKWVYGLDGYRLNFPGTVEPLMPKLVVDIMNKREGRSNISLIEQWISEQEKQAIMRLPICKTQEEDKLVWPHNIGGNYSVKSDYNMLRTEKGFGRGNVCQTLFVKSTSNMRKLLSTYFLVATGESITTFDDWLLAVFGNIERLELGVAGRCDVKVVMQGKQVDLWKTIKRIQIAWKEMMDCKEGDGNLKRGPEATSLQSFWERPEEHWLKINYDGALSWSCC